MENEQIVRAFQQGELTQNDCCLQLYEQNVRFIKKQIQPYCVDTLTAEDLLQESYFAVVDAVLTFDDSMECKFVSWLSYYLKKYCRLYEFNNGAIHISANKIEKIRDYKRTKDLITMQSGYVPSLGQMAEYTGMSFDECSVIENTAKSVLSLDFHMETAEDDSLTLGDTIASGTDMERDILDQVFADERSHIVWSVVDSLPNTSQIDVLKEYYIKCKTLEQIAKEKKVSANQINELRKKGLRQLRTGKKMVELRKLINDDDCFYHVGVESFQRTGISAVEKAVFNRENLRNGLKNLASNAGIEIDF